MDDEREIKETMERTGAESVCSQDFPKKSYAQGKLLSQETFNEDDKPTTAVPPSDNEVNLAYTVAGVTQFSNVKNE